MLKIPLVTCILLYMRNTNDIDIIVWRKDNIIGQLYGWQLIRLNDESSNLFRSVENLVNEDRFANTCEVLIVSHHFNITKYENNTDSMI